MTQNKKSLFLQKLSRGMSESPLLLILQHNNLNRTEWSQLKTQLKKIQNTRLSLVKNKLVETFLHSKDAHTPHHVSQPVGHLFQGPCCIVGLRDLQDFALVWNVLKSTRGILFVGGVFHGQVFNHLDIEKVATLDFSIYHQFLGILNHETRVTPLSHGSEFVDMFHPQRDFSRLMLSFLHCLEVRCHLLGKQ
jgi:ribosomal protein L10